MEAETIIFAKIQGLSRGLVKNEVVVGKDWPQPSIVARVRGDLTTNPLLQIGEPNGICSPPTGIPLLTSELLS